MRIYLSIRTLPPMELYRTDSIYFNINTTTIPKMSRRLPLSLYIQSQYLKLYACCMHVFIGGSSIGAQGARAPPFWLAMYINYCSIVQEYVGLSSVE